MCFTMLRSESKEPVAQTHASEQAQSKRANRELLVTSCICLFAMIVMKTMSHRNLETRRVCITS